MVRYHLFRSQSRALFDRFDAGEAEEVAPLGFVADTLEDQQAWFAKQLAKLEPHTPVLRVADLAKSGMFEAIVSNAPDRLLDRALRLVGVAHKIVSLEDPSAPEGGRLPLLREWDVRVFRDTQDRRARENTFIEARLEALLQPATGVLIVGQSSRPADLMDRLLDALAAHPDKRVVWIRDRASDDGGSEVIDEIRLRHQHLTVLDCDSLGDFFEEVGEERGVAKSPLLDHTVKEPLLKRTLNKDFDVRPILVFVPGVALLGGLIDRLPRISVKMALSLLSLIAALLGYVNYGIWKEYDEQIAPVKAHMAAAREQLAGPDGALRSEGELVEAEAKIKRVVLPYTSMFSFGIVHQIIERDLETTQIDLKSARDLGLTPALYARRLETDLQADPSHLILAQHPPIQVVEGVVDDARDERGIRFRRHPLSSYRLPQPLANYQGEPRVVLYCPSATLLRVIAQEHMLADLTNGRVPFGVDLSGNDGPLEQQIFDSARATSGYVDKRASLFSPDGLIKAMSEGRATFYFFHLESSGVARNLGRIRDLLERYPKARAVMSLYTERGRQQIAELAPELKLLSLHGHSWGEALAYLRSHTSADFVRGIMRDNHLRTHIDDPLIASLLIDYFRFSHKAPDSFAQVYDRLLHNMLDRGEYGFAPKRRLLAALARESFVGGRSVTRERAAEIVSLELFRNIDLDKAAAVLDELVATGVLRYEADTHVAFMEEAARDLCAAKSLRGVSLEERIGFLLRHDEQITAFYAGLFGEGDGLVTAMLAPFYETDRRLRAEQLDLSRVNRFAVNLRHAAVAARNGDTGPTTLAKLEGALFRLSQHQIGAVAAEARKGLHALSSPSVRRWVLTGLDDNVPYDAQLLGFTATASEEIYAPAVAAWLDRVGTSADPQHEARFNHSHHNEAPDGPAEVRRDGLTAETTLAIYEGLTTLAQIGTADSLRLLTEWAQREDDPRFGGGADWRKIRAAAVTALVASHHLAEAQQFIAAIEAKPEHWDRVVFELYRFDDARAAQALINILARPVKFDDGVKAYKVEAATALALMNRNVAVPLVAEVLEREPASQWDYGAWAALSLGLRGDPEDINRVATYVAKLRQTYGSATRSSFHQASIATVSRAVASFGTGPAMALFSELYRDEKWREFDRAMSYELPRLRKAGAAEFAATELLCRAGPPQIRDFVTPLGLMHSSEARRELRRLVTMLESDPAADFVAARCGAEQRAAVATRIDGWRTNGLGHFVDALSFDRAEEDLPLFARWALHADAGVRRTAVQALGGYQDIAASRAVKDSMQIYPASARDAIVALGRQGMSANEPFLLELLAGEADRGAVIDALGRSGGEVALRRLDALQEDEKLGQRVGAAMLQLAERLRGESVVAAPKPSN